MQDAQQKGIETMLQEVLRSALAVAKIQIHAFPHLRVLHRPALKELLAPLKLLAALKMHSSTRSLLESISKCH